MPKVFLTGANGFLATHILKDLVEESFDVVGTVRSQAKADDVFFAHPEFASKVKLVAVPDMSKAGTYDKIFQETQFDYIIHTASPVPDGDGTDFDRDFLGPAVQGLIQDSNLELLRAAQKYLKTLKHLTFTGSVANVRNPMEPYDGMVLTSKDWNQVDPDVARKMQHPGASYIISKTLAEKALWKFVETEKPAFTVSVLTVPLIIGPPLQRLDQHAFSKGRTNMTSDLFYNTLLKPVTGLDPGTGQPLYTAYIDVRDLAVLHVQSLTKGADTHRRIIMANPEPFLAKNVLEILGQRFPDMEDRWASVQAASIVANKEQDTEHPVKVDDAEARAVFGERIYRSLSETVIDTAMKLLEIE
ncbi:hypothetical protein LTS03_004102 [Exophiala xenobiotica]|nr:hypothetical protein LTR41_000632 [Exophiala xenobiotica]KAK5381262.1 hypothetical protein LTS03_004102 [Exophiala xenobiotica]